MSYKVRFVGGFDDGRRITLDLLGSGPLLSPFTDLEHQAAVKQWNDRYLVAWALGWDVPPRPPFPQETYMIDWSTIDDDEVIAVFDHVERAPQNSSDASSSSSTGGTMDSTGADGPSRNERTDR